MIYQKVELFSVKHKYTMLASVVKLVDTSDSKSDSLGSDGSSPSTGIL